MKSIIQEASSIAKAIEKGWLKAGKPQDFSIKIFQEAEKNFIGMTTKPAKIAVIFNEHVEPLGSRHQKAPRTLQEHPERVHPQAKPVREKRERKLEPVERPRREPEQPKVHVEKKTRVLPAQSRELESRDQERMAPWSDELTQAAVTWLKDSLEQLGYANIQFSTNINRQLLKIQFSTPLVSDTAKQKHLFRSLAFLLMQTLRRQFKRPLRNAHIVLISE